MKREVIPFTDEASWKRERAKDITSTTVSALFGMSPYLTHFELWHRHHGDGDFEVESFENERTAWGKRLQDSIAQGFAADTGVNVSPMPEYVRLSDERVGSSFDYVGMGLLPPKFILECKNVDGLEFRRGWAEEEGFGLQAPAHIEIQVQHQMLVSGLKRAYIAALVGGNRLVLLEREYDEVVGTRILEACAAFWKSKSAPEPDFSRDAAFVSRLYRQSGEGKTVTADARIEELMAVAKSAGEEMVAWEKKQKAAKAELLTLIEDAERVEGSAYYALARTLPPVEVAAYTRKGSRPVKIYERKS